MAKWIIAATLAALVLVSGAAVSAHGNTVPNGHGKPAPKATATPLRTPTPVYTATPLSTATYTPVPTFTPSPTPYASESQREQETVDLINQRRVAMGLGTLRVDSALTTAARRQSYDIGPLNLCQHYGTDGSTPQSRVIDAGYTGSYQGEVVGCGFLSSQSVVDAWWGSPEHYAILTQSTADDIGCGWWVDSSGRGWATCDLGWTAR